LGWRAKVILNYFIRKLKNINKRKEVVIMNEKKLVILKSFNRIKELLHLNI